MTCADCGFVNPAEMRFCGGCGSALPRPCARCGAAMPAAFHFCGECGATLGAQSLTLPSGTRQMTVVFADISGFTSLAERLTPAELHETMRTAWDAIAVEIRAAGGMIEKYIGDAVVAVFGAREQQDDHPERAQRAALAIVAALERTNTAISQRSGTRLALRVGLNSGIAVTGAIGDSDSEFGVLGDAVNVAARLEHAAEPGEILVGDATYRQSADLFTYEPHPAVVARGKAIPLIAWRLVGVAAGMTAGSARPLVGREAPLAAAVAALDEALTGTGRLVSIVGEAGLGKTRLLTEIIGHPHTRGARIGLATCARHDAHRAYGAMSDLLRRLLAIAPGTSVEHAMRLLNETVPEIEPEARALLLSILGYSVSAPPMSPETRRRLLQRAVSDLLVAVAESQGLVAIVDDAQWLDTASVRLVAELAPILAGTRALLVLAHRPDFVPPWANAANHLSLRLQPLDGGEATALVAQVASGLPEPVAHEIVARSGGNPAFIHEATRWARDSGLVTPGDLGAVITDVSKVAELPGSMPLLVLKRVEALSVGARRALFAAAVLGDGSTELLRATCRNEVEVDSALEELVAAAMLEPRSDGRSYRFAHSLLRELIYGAIPVRHRDELHGRAALAIENGLPELAARQPELLAHHFGSSSRSGRAAEYASRSGDRAMSLSALEDGLFHHRGAARAAAGQAGGGSGERARALLAACDAARSLDRTVEALAAAEEALAESPADPALRAALRRRAGLLCAQTGSIERAAEHLADAEMRTPSDGPERAELTLAKAHLAGADQRPGEALAIAHAAAREAAAGSDPALALRAELAVVAFARQSGAHEEVRRGLERCAGLAIAAGDLAALAGILAERAELALDHCEIDAAERLGHELLAHQTRLGDVAGRAAALRTIAAARLERGDLTGAWAAAEEALALSGREPDLTDPTDPALTLRLRSTILRLQGDAAASRSALDLAGLYAGRSLHAATHLRALLAADQARLALDASDLESARAHAATALAERHAHLCRRCGAEIAPTLIAVARAANDLAAANEHRSDGLEQALRLDLRRAIRDIERASPPAASGAAEARPA